MSESPQQPTLETIAHYLAIQYVDDALEEEGRKTILAELVQAEARGFQRCLDLHLTAQVARVGDLLKAWQRHNAPVDAGPEKE